jgi:NTE family protein
VGRLQYQELRGHEYVFGRIAHLRKLTDLQTLFGQALDAGVSVDLGNMYDRIDRSDAQGLIFGSSVFFGGRTPLGPLVFMFGVAEAGRKAAYLQIGRPLQPR